MKFQRNLKISSSLSRIVLSDGSFKRFALSYFENHPAPFDYDREFNLKEKFDIVEACYFFLLADSEYFRFKWTWSKFFRRFLDDSTTIIFWYAAHCFAEVFKLNEAQLNALLRKALKNKEEYVRYEIYVLDRRLFFQNQKYDQEKLIADVFASEEALYTSIENVCLPKVKRTKIEDETLFERFVLVDSSKRNCLKIALCLAAGKAVLLQGTVGSAKTTLVEYLAWRTGRILGESFFKVQMSDQVDSKSLLGTYHCTDVPGEFVWRPGVLTEAITNGHWLLLEDIDYAETDIITIVCSLLENRSFTLQGFCERLPIHPQFQLFFTQRISTTGMGTAKTNKIMTPNICLLEKHAMRVQIEPLSNDELETIILKQFPVYKQMVSGMINVYQLFTKISLSENSRLFSVRDLFKWCSRSAKNYALKKSTIELLYNAMAVFSFSFPSPKSQLKYAKLIFSTFSLGETHANHLFFLHTPKLSINLKYFEIDLIRIEKNQDKYATYSMKYHDRFALTRQALLQLEKIGACVQFGEPVLLVGETGTGKTTCVQYLAERLGRKLVVINMSQQSDSKNLLGGYKPVDFKYLIGAFKNDFFKCLELANQNDSSQVLRSINVSHKEEKWSEMLTQMKSVVKAKFSIFGEQFFNRLQKFERVMVHENKMMFAFVEGSLIKAIENGDWVLFDEINLATADTLTCLSSLLEDHSDHIHLTEMANGKTSIKKHPEFRLFACMNPATDVGKKDLPVGLRNRFTEFYINELTDKKDVYEMVKTYLRRFQLSNLFNQIADFYLEMRQRHQEDQTQIFSLRTLCRALSIAARNPCGNQNRSLYEAFCTSFLTQLGSVSCKKIEPKIRQLFAPPKIDSLKWLNHRIAMPSRENCTKNSTFIEVEGFWIYSERTRPPVTGSNFILTESFQQRLKHLARIVSISDLPILLQGETGVGKTRIIEHLAEITENKCYRINNHENITIDQYIGTYVVDKNGKLVFREGLLVEAMVNGYWIILDELNLAPTDVLEALNRVLDDNRELRIDETQQVIKAASNFRIFATQNPPAQYGGRKILSRAFRNRFIELHFSDIPLNELEYILSKRCELPPSYSKKMIAVMCDLQRLTRVSATFSGKKGFMTLRDLFRWGERFKSSPDKQTKGGYDWEKHLAEIGYLILAGRVRNTEESQDILDAIAKNFKKTIELQNLFSLHENTSEITRPILEQLVLLNNNLTVGHRIVWTSAMRKLAVLVVLALERNEPVLLVGETGGGKTTVCQALAQIRQQKLVCLNCHLNTESADFIGGLRPSCASERANALFEWSNGPLLDALYDGNLFLADEINLVEHSALERLNSLLETERSLLIIEKGDEFESVVAHEQFQFIGTMNPANDYGKKELSAALRNRFTEIWCDVSFNRDDFELIAFENLSKEHFNEDRRRAVATKMLDFVEWFKKSEIGSRFVISIRDILTWTKFVNCCPQLSTEQSLLHGASLTFLDSFGSNVTSLNSKSVLEEFHSKCIAKLKSLQNNSNGCDVIEIVEDDRYFSVGPFSIEKGAGRAVEKSARSQRSSCSAPTIVDNLLKILRAMQLKKAVLLEGDPGVGKTKLVSLAAEKANRQLVRINVSNDTEFGDLIGNYYPKENGQSGEFVWNDGPFLQALKNGSWILIDELNLASQSVLEGLNACLDHRSEVFVPEIGQTFPVKCETRIFACQNPLKQGGARKGLPKSFLNRFTQVYINPLQDSDLMDILHTNYENIPFSLIEKMVEFNNEVVAAVKRNDLGTSGGPWEFNLRDMSRWCDAVVWHKSNNCSGDANAAALATMNLIYGDRLHLSADRTALESLFEKVFITRASKETNAEINGAAKLSHTTLQPFFQLTEDRVTIQDVFLRRFENKSASKKNYSTFCEQDLIVLRSQLHVLRSLMFAVNLNWMSILVGAEDAKKKSVIATLAKLLDCDLKIVSVNSEMDITDLLGGYEQKDYNRNLDEIAKSLKDVVLSIDTELKCISSADDLVVGQAVKLLEKWEVFMNFVRTQQNDAKSKTFVEQMDGFVFKIELLTEIVELCLRFETNLASSSLLSKLRSLEAELKQLNCEIETGKKQHDHGSFNGKFEWVDSLLVKCLQSGTWLLIENANFCNAAIFDRLNCLLEPNGVLVVNERGSNDQNLTAITIKPHPNFRLFLTMDPKFGEISRAMRNRGVEVFMSAIETLDSNRLDIESLLLAANLKTEQSCQLVRNVHDSLVAVTINSPEKPTLVEMLKLSDIVAQQLHSGFDLKSALNLGIVEVYSRFDFERQTIFQHVENRIDSTTQKEPSSDSCPQRKWFFCTPAICVRNHHNITQTIRCHNFGFERVLHKSITSNQTELLMNMLIGNYQLCRWQDLKLQFEFVKHVLKRFQHPIVLLNEEIHSFLEIYGQAYTESSLIDPRWLVLQQNACDSLKTNVLFVGLRCRVIVCLLNESLHDIDLKMCPKNTKDYQLIGFSHQARKNSQITHSTTRSKLVIDFEAVLELLIKSFCDQSNIDSEQTIRLIVALEWYRIYHKLARMKIFVNFNEKFAALYVHFQWLKKYSKLAIRADSEIFHLFARIDQNLLNFDDLSTIEIVRSYWKRSSRPLPFTQKSEIQFLEKCEKIAKNLSFQTLTLNQLFAIFNDTELFETLFRFKLSDDFAKVEEAILRIRSNNETDTQSFSNLICLNDYVMIRLLTNIRSSELGSEAAKAIEMLQSHVCHANLQTLFATDNFLSDSNLRSQFDYEIIDYLQICPTLKNNENLPLRIYNPSFTYNSLNWLLMNCSFGQWKLFQSKIAHLMMLSRSLMLLFQKNDFCLMRNDYHFILNFTEKFLRELLYDDEQTSSSTSIIEMIDSISVRLIDADHNKKLGIVFSHLKCFVQESNENRTVLNLAKIFSTISYLKLRLNCQLPIIDPLMKFNLKKQNLKTVKENLEELKIAFEMQNEQLSNHCTVQYPLYKPLDAALSEVTSKLNKVSRKSCHRLQPSTVTYHGLVEEVREFVRSAELMSGFENLLNCADDCRVLSFALKCQSWINAQHRFRSKLDRYKYIFRDIVLPILEASTNFTYALNLLKFSHDQSLSETQTVEKYSLNLQQFFEGIVQYPVSGCDLFITTCFDSKFRQFFIDNQYENGLIAIFRSILLDIQNCFIIADAVNDQSLLIKLLYMILKITTVWNDQEKAKQIKKAEEESLYRIRAINLDNIDEDIENDDEEMEKFFVNYHDKDFDDFYVDHLNDAEEGNGENEEADNGMLDDVKKRNKRVKKTVNDRNDFLSAPDFEFMCKMHVELMLKFTRTKWLSDMHRSKTALKIDLCKPLMNRFEVLKTLLPKYVHVLDFNVDKCTIQALNLVFETESKFLKNESRDSHDSYDFYNDANVARVSVALETLKVVETEVLRLLVLYPEQPTLTQTLLVINRIASFSVTSSVARFLTGFEILLSKWFEWCQNSPRDALKDEINRQITDIVIDWRKLELENWKNSLNVAKKRLADQAYKLWVHIYNIMMEFIKLKKLTAQEIIEIMQEFMENSNLAEFTTRLRILLAFHCNLSHLKVSKEQSLMLVITWNVYEYYRQFSETVDTKIADTQKPIERKVCDFVKICQWKDINYWSVRNTVDKTHKTLHKFIKEFESELKKPAKQFLVICKSDWTEKSASLEKKNGTKTKPRKFVVDFSDCTSSVVQPEFASRSSEILGKAFENMTCGKLSVIFKDYVDSMIDRVKHLSSLEVGSVSSDGNAVDDKQKAKRISLAKSILQQKKQCLAGFFKTLTQIGLSYRRGLVQRQKQSNEALDFLQKPFDFDVFFESTHVAKKTTCDQQLRQLWSGCKLHYMKCVARLIRFETVAVSVTPSSDFGAQNLERCTGFAFDLMHVVQQQKAQLHSNAVLVYQLTLLQSDFDTIDQRLSSEALILSRSNCKNLQQLMQRTHLIMVQYKALYENRHRNDTPFDFLIESTASFPDLGDFNKISELTNFAIIDIDNASYKVIESKADFAKQADLLMSEIQILEKGLRPFTSTTLLNETIVDLLKLKTKILRDASKASDARLNDDNFNEKIRRSVHNVLIKVQNVFKISQSKATKISDDDLFDGHLTKLMIKDLQEIMSELGVADTIKKLRTLLKRYFKSGLDRMVEARLDLLQLRPYLEIISAFFKHLIADQINHYRLSAKMLSLMLNVFHELARNGFCVPKDLEGEMTDVDDNSSGMGLTDGTGEKDVSDRIESSDQLDDAKRENDEKEEQAENEDIGDDVEGGGIDMDEDFDGVMENLPEKEQEDDKDGNDDSEDENHDEEMGDVDDENLDKLDEKIWQDDQPDDENEKQDDGEDDGDDDKKKKDDKSKTGQVNKSVAEYSSDQLDPYNNQENAYPEPQDFEMPQDMDLDQINDEGGSDHEETKGEESAEDQHQNNGFENDEEMDDVANDDEVDKLDPAKTEDFEDLMDFQDSEENCAGEEQECVDENKDDENVNADKDGDDEGSAQETEANDDAENTTGDFKDDDNMISETEPNLNDKTSYNNSNQQDNVTESNLEGESSTDLCKNSIERGGERVENIPLPNSDNPNEKPVDQPKQKLKQPSKKRTLGSKEESIRKKVKLSDSETDKQNREAGNPQSQNVTEYEHIESDDASESGCDQMIDAADDEQCEQQKLTNNDIARDDEEEAKGNSDEQPKDIETKSLLVLKTNQKNNYFNKNNRDKNGDDQSDDENGDGKEQSDEIEGKEGDREHANNPLTLNNDESAMYTNTETLTDSSRLGSVPMDVDSDRAKEHQMELERQLGALGEEQQTAIEHETVEQDWSKIVAKTLRLSYNLAENLRFVLEPMQASKLQGYYRTGRRIDMRKIIPYIASNFVKDKIWLRRTKPNNRNFHIVLAIDDSKSMRIANLKEMALESIAIISKALTILEAGKLSVVTFGERTKVVHKFEDQFTDSSGAKLLQELQFEQKETRTGEMIDFVTNYFESYMEGMSGNITNSKLLFIITDLRDIFQEPGGLVKKAFQRSQSANVITVIIIIENPEQEYSITSHQIVWFDEHRKPKFAPYIDSIPFPFYLIVRKVDSIPHVLGEVLKQWFELFSNS